MSTVHILKLLFICLSLAIVTPLARKVDARTAPRKAKVPAKAKPEPSNPNVIQLLTSVQNKLSNEAARLQIQARGLSKAEIERLNTLYQSIGNLKEMITQLEKTALKEDHFAQPKAFAREPKPNPKPKVKPKQKPKAKAKPKPKSKK